MCDFSTAADDAGSAAEQWLVKELMEGLEGEDIEVTTETWERMEQEALRLVFPES